MASSIAPSVRGAVGVMLCLADMPDLTCGDLALLIAFRKEGGRSIIGANPGGRAGHPVVFPSRLFTELLELGGDVGAREVVVRHAGSIIDVEIGAAARIDFDTMDTLFYGDGRW